MGFFGFIFVFLLGGVVALIGAAFAVYYFLLIFEHKTAAQREKLAKEASPEESQRAVSLLIPQLETQVRFSFAPSPWPKEALKRMQHTKIVLKANMFFHFKDEKKDVCSIARMDGCQVKVLRAEGKAKFNKKNYLKIASPAGSLFPDGVSSSSTSTASKSNGEACYIKFNNGKDLEQWYYALKAASSLTSTKNQKEVELLQLQQRYFAHLTAVATNSGEVNADWANALLGRVFWGVHNHPKFISLITQKLQKKFAKLKKPKFVESIAVSDVGFGPNLPLFSNIKIIFVSPQGSLAFDGDVYYHGGFNLMIDIMLRIDLPVGNITVAVPIRASVVVKAFAGRGHIQVAPPPSKRAWIGFYGEPRVDLDVKIEVGKDMKLVNIPSIANIVINKIKQQLIKKLVLPAMDDWPLPHIPKTEETPATSNSGTVATPERESTRSSALLSSTAADGITSASLSQTSSVSSPVIDKRITSMPEKSASSSSAALSSASKRHSVAVIPQSDNQKGRAPITVRTRTSPRDRVAKPEENPPTRQSSLTQSLKQPASPLIETGSPSSSRPSQALTTYPAGASSTSPPKEGVHALTSMQLPSSPPRGQWNSTDEWYQNSLMALRDRDDDSSDSDNDDTDKQAIKAQVEQVRLERDRKEKEDRDKKLREENERKERERQEKEKAERERREQEERERQEKERAERERREQEEQEKKAKEESERQEREEREEQDRITREKKLNEEKERIEREAQAEERRQEATPKEEQSKSEVVRVKGEAPTNVERQESEDELHEIEQFTNISKPDQPNPIDEARMRKDEEEERNRQEEAEKARKEHEKKEQEKKEREKRENETLTGISKKEEVFSDPLSSTLNSPIVEEIFGSNEQPPLPKRPSSQSDADRLKMPNVSTGAPALPERKRSDSLNTPTRPPVVQSKAPELPPRAHAQQTASQSSTKYRTTSHMFENFDFSFPSVPSTPAPAPAPPSAPSSSSFLGLTTPVGPVKQPSPSVSPSTSPSSTDDLLFTLSAPTSSTSATKQPAKKGLFNMDDLFNKVEKQHHLVEKFKAAKARAQNALNDWKDKDANSDL